MSSKRCRWLDLNPSRLVSEATALSFAPQQQFKLCLKFTTTLSVKLFTSGRLLSKWTKICLFFLLSSIQWNIEHNRLHMEKAQMACLGFEPVTAGWKVQTTPLSWCSPHPSKYNCLRAMIFESSFLLPNISSSFTFKMQIKIWPSRKEKHSAQSTRGVSSSENFAKNKGRRVGKGSYKLKWKLA